MKTSKLVTSLCLTLGALLPASCAGDTTAPPSGSNMTTGNQPSRPAGTAGSSSAPQGGSGTVVVQPSAGTTSNGASGSAANPNGGNASAGNNGVAGTSANGGSSGGGPVVSGPPDPTCATGLLKGSVCCAASCGVCGGMGCGDHPGGSTACCNMPIMSSGVSCASSGPPCIMGGGSGGSGNTGGSGNNGGTGNGAGSGSTGDNPCTKAGLTWKSANKTNFESYPDPGSEECIKYNGCTWAGEFAFCDGKKPESWVKAHDIVAVFPQTGLENHDICIKSGNKTMVVTVLDTCGDSDCDGCCTENLGDADRLIDLEKYTNQRWGLEDGDIQWADLGSNSSSCN